MKTLLFGPANAGKTSLMRTACLGYAFVKVSDLKPTKGISRENFIFRGLLELTIWDSGGQEAYLDKYFNDQKDVVFSEVEIPIFMVDSCVVNTRVNEVAWGSGFFVGIDYCPYKIFQNFEPDSTSDYKQR